LSTRLTPFVRLCVLAVLSVGVLFTAGAGAAQDAATGAVVAWGCGSDSALCSVPAAALSGVTAITAGVVHSLALKQDGSVIAWGCPTFNDYGQCTVPPAAASSVTAIAANVYDSLALKQDGSVIAWGCGSGNYGQCTVPAAAASGVTAIAAGHFHSLALKQDGSVIAWGCGPGGNYGQCTVPPAAASGVTATYQPSKVSLGARLASMICPAGHSSRLSRDPSQCAARAAAVLDSSALGVDSFRRHSRALAQANGTPLRVARRVNGD
jgi:alpha-tubulin suppressor-like RCC1 family protein